MSFRFHNIKSFSSSCIFQQIQYMSPQASTRTEECAKSRCGKAKSFPCATPLPQVYLCQLQMQCTLTEVKGYKNYLLSLQRKKIWVSNFAVTIQFYLIFVKLLCQNLNMHPSPTTCCHMYLYTTFCTTVGIGMISLCLQSLCSCWQ